MLSRQPYSFYGNMSWARHDIKRVFFAYFMGSRQVELVKISETGELKRIVYGKRRRCGWGKNGKYLKNEIKSIALEIKHGIFNRGQ